MVVFYKTSSGDDSKAYFTIHYSAKLLTIRWWTTLQKIVSEVIDYIVSEIKISESRVTLVRDALYKKCVSWGGWRGGEGGV